MDNRRKNMVFSLILVVVLIAGYWYQQEQTKPPLTKSQIQVAGTTMGVVPYAITYIDLKQRQLKPGIDSLLQAFNQSLSTYIENSAISTFNKNGAVKPDKDFFLPMLQKSQEVYLATNGAFDPTVGPLVNAWGFGNEGKEATLPDSATIDSLRQYVGFNKLVFNQDTLYTTQPGIKLNFSAIAKGFAVDLVGNYLKAQGLENYFVEIGGEVVAAGLSADGDPWITGIAEPQGQEQDRGVFVRLQFTNAAIATSGNYRNYRVVNGRMVAHTISPATGFPVLDGLLSASVVAPDCTTADAYSTAFMVLGLEKSKQVLNAHKELKAYLVYASGPDSLATYGANGLNQLILAPTQQP